MHNKPNKKAVIKTAFFLLLFVQLIYLLAEDAGGDGDIFGTGTTVVVLLGAGRWGRIVLLLRQSE